MDVSNVVNVTFRLNYVYEPGRLPPRRQMFYQLVDVQIQQVAEESFQIPWITILNMLSIRPTVYDIQYIQFLEPYKRGWKIENHVIIFARSRMVG